MFFAQTSFLYGYSQDEQCAILCFLSVACATYIVKVFFLFLWYLLSSTFVRNICAAFVCAPHWGVPTRINIPTLSRFTKYLACYIVVAIISSAKHTVFRFSVYFYKCNLFGVFFFFFCFLHHSFRKRSVPSIINTHNRGGGESLIRFDERRYGVCASTIEIERISLPSSFQKKRKFCFLAAEFSRF